MKPTDLTDQTPSNALPEPAPFVELIDEKEYARRLGVSASYPRKQRVKGDGPPYYLLGSTKHIRYRWADVLTWLETRKRLSTSPTLSERRVQRAHRKNAHHHVTATAIEDD